MQTVGLECRVYVRVCVRVCAAARAALQLRDVVVHCGVHGVIGLGDGRGATWWKERRMDRFKKKKANINAYPYLVGHNKKNYIN